MSLVTLSQITRGGGALSALSSVKLTVLAIFLIDTSNPSELLLLSDHNLAGTLGQGLKGPRGSLNPASFS